MPSIFSRIIAGEIPSYTIAESGDYLAFLDIAPLKKGHALVVPKKEVDYIFDLDKSTYLGLMEFSARVAKAIEKVVPCKRMGIVVMGLEVPHAHVHLIPIDQVGDTDFANARLKFSQQEYSELAKQILAHFPETIS